MPKLRFSNSLTKNFPKDFFHGRPERTQPASPKCNHAVKDEERILPMKNLRPVKLNSKLIRIASPTSAQKLGVNRMDISEEEEFFEPRFQQTQAKNAQKRRKNHLSAQKYFESDPTVNIINSKIIQRQVRMNKKDRMDIKSLSITREKVVQDQQPNRLFKPPKTNASLSLMRMKNGSSTKEASKIGLFLRPKSLRKTIRRKNILNFSSQVKSYKGIRAPKPHFSNEDLPYYRTNINEDKKHRSGLLSEREKIRNFYTRNTKDIQEFSLPEIATNRSVLPSTAACNKGETDCFSSNSSAQDDPCDSDFLLKLEKMCQPMNQTEDVDNNCRGTAYFGT
ncbi:unnamed protein product [Moneuplotes crassus]|uniref:Uncharacterized protein n=1 Tax=Euplotes crassus TaxID=5936 RepID=A0AAD1UEQ5_EUPCR|nr:unnamed protein product [Moneuplotes crassus]